MKTAIVPSASETFFDESEIIVSKTDRKGRLTYTNQTFCRLAGYTEAELLGQPHSIVRHPDMPRAIFKLLWDAITGGREVFAYVKNLAKDGSFYWVFAHVTPSYDSGRNVIGFHSSRRVPDRRILDGSIIPLYSAILDEERKHQNGQKALAAGFDHLSNLLKTKGMSYEALIFSL